MKKVFLLLVIAILFNSCIEPIPITTGVGSTLVVDGWITNQPGPYQVKLSRSIPYDNSKQVKVYSVPESNAKVTVQVSDGSSEILVETPSKSGIYPIRTLVGQIGKTYQLKIQTADGRQYSSQPEKMQSGPDIASIDPRYRITETLTTNANGSSIISKKEDFAIYVVVNDQPGISNFYRWQASGIFEFFSINDNSAFKQCWAPTPDRLEVGLQVAKDVNFEGNRYEQYIAIVPYDRVSLYLITVRQQALTESGYNFLKRIADQQTSTGSLFDPPPTAIPGNIYNDSNSEEVVLGFFGAASQLQKSLLINRFQLSGRVNPSRNIIPVAGDCRFQVPNATNIKPPGFPD